MPITSHTYPGIFLTRRDGQPGTCEFREVSKYGTPRCGVSRRYDIWYCYGRPVLQRQIGTFAPARCSSHIGTTKMTHPVNIGQQQEYLVSSDSRFCSSANSAPFRCCYSLNLSLLVPHLELRFSCHSNGQSPSQVMRTLS
ncbi:hypothetical protein M404DRAFT_389129 [Pisolithus tinctorius Marx 270]|uniref:Uncharacterized protein n=1 Tax=Pisolithus tinctorius Marx 270 TaxID=870435 RepID=A0A0C3JES1_PISTI|nr:hypothetical protein M404DRAFT_389129 [Pisolithus tinctorius Marx 270]